jgi:hypothetical protein
MLGFAGTLDDVSPGGSQIENPSGTLYGGVRARGGARHNLLGFFLLSGQQAADKLRPFPSIAFDCPF